MRSHSCPKCQSTMVEGFLPTEKSSMHMVSTWCEGVPVKGWWGVKNKATPIEIASWRCSRCGYLENYAKA